ncbi:MAG: HAD family hydrolase [FCB group bacterium]|nr:HAD family hydrolase [FCB group bacterium]
MNQPCKCIIFDLSYTLIEYRKCSWPEVLDTGLQEAYRYLECKNEILTPFTDFKNHFAIIKERRRIEASKTLAGWKAADIIGELLKQLKIKTDDEFINNLLECIHAPIRELMYIQDDTVESLRSLKDAGFCLGIISNTINPPFLHLTDLEILGLSSFFDFAIFSSECPHRKPHPSIFELGIKKAGFPADKIMYVGDHYGNDIIGAKAVGMRAVLKFHDRQKYPDPLPEDLPVIHCLGELTGLINIPLN